MYLWREICVSKSIGRFCFVLLYICIPRTSPRGDLTEGFLRYRFGGLVFGVAYTRRDLFSEFYGTPLLILSIYLRKVLK